MRDTRLIGMTTHTKQETTHAHNDCQSDPVTYRDKSDIDGMLVNSCQEGFLPNESCGGFALKGVVSVTAGDAIEEAEESYEANQY